MDMPPYIAAVAAVYLVYTGFRLATGRLSLRRQPDYAFWLGTCILLIAAHLRAGEPAAQTLIWLALGSLVLGVVLGAWRRRGTAAASKRIGKGWGGRRCPACGTAAPWLLRERCAGCGAALPARNFLLGRRLVLTGVLCMAPALILFGAWLWLQGIYTRDAFASVPGQWRGLVGGLHDPLLVTVGGLLCIAGTLLVSAGSYYLQAE